MLGSLLGVSGPSYFINDGNRYNMGNVGTSGTYESRGIIIGLVLVAPMYFRTDHGSQENYQDRQTYQIRCEGFLGY